MAMGYYYTAEPENAVPAKFWATPKTHVPGSPVKERGHRYLMPETGRWLNRDPIGEDGGLAIYVINGNRCVDLVDPIGLELCSVIGGIKVCVSAPEDSEPPYEYPPDSPESGKKCCGGKPYDSSSDCCENDKVAPKESIWVCRRKLRGPNSWWPKIGPLSHTFIVCEDPQKNPNTQEKYGKQPRAKNPWWGPGQVEREPWSDFRDCKEQTVCPIDKKRMCKEGPTEKPYFLPSPWHNCHAWGNCRSK